MLTRRRIMQVVNAVTVVVVAGWVAELHAQLGTHPDEPTQATRRTVNVANATEWAAAMDGAQAGDYINITAGFSLASSRVDDALGTAANPIIVQGNGHTLTSTSQYNPWYWKSASHFYLINIHFDAAENAQWGPSFGGLSNSQSEETKGYSNNVHMWGCEIENTRQQGSVWRRVYGGSVIGCYLHDISSKVYVEGTSGSGNSGSMLYMGGGGYATDKSTDILVERSHFTRHHPNGVTRAFNVKVACERITFRRNYVHDMKNRSNGLVTFFSNSSTNNPAGDHLVEENVIHGAEDFEFGSNGIHMGQTGVVRRNIVFDMANRGIQAIGSFYSAAKDLWYDSNTVFDCGNTDIAPDGEVNSLGAGLSAQPTYTRTNNLCEDTTGEHQATAADFVSAPTGTWDSGDGPGSGALVAAGSSLPAAAGALGKDE